MKPLHSLVCLLLAGGLSLSAHALADERLPAQHEPLTPTVVCTREASAAPRLAQGLPLACCKDHKGICGCRAGKLVCCDGTVSKDPACTCHADTGIDL
ncbi:MAG: hypothetical protein N2Z63_01035 [Thiobacillaceae bacterium]|nr:hypothetical protein [Thiobacillaceae bacterium]